jgi:CRISPR-associated endoribonuclease Cas6
MRMTFSLNKKPSVKEVGDAIYACITASDSHYSEQLHNAGTKHSLKHETRTASWTLKPFHYSHPYQDMHGNHKIKIASPDSKFWYHFIQGKDALGSNALINKHTPAKIQRMSVIRSEDKVFADVFMLSPLVIRTHDCESGFVESLNDTKKVNHLIISNLFRKRDAFGIKPSENSFFKILKIENISRKDKSYKGQDIPAFYINMHVLATEDMFETAYYCGIGSKNALGFGMLESSQKNNMQ